MANHRNEIEDGIVELLAPLKTAGSLKTLMAIGGQDYETVLRSALGQAPFAIVKYTGKTGALTGGGLKDVPAEISIMIGAKSYKSIQAQKQTIFDLLDGIENLIDGKRLGDQDCYFPLVMVREQWSQISGSGLEVWEQAYQLSWQEKTAV